MLKWLKKIFVPAVDTKEEVLVLKKQVIGKKSELTKMSKVQLEELGRAYDVELDRRLTKAKLVDQLWKIVKPKK
jgi:hypothetical protein|tara:strand:- start:8979 stop:9200 length:222 start_codon:yes stop_codon:yes gene_type:complete